MMRLDVYRNGRKARWGQAATKRLRLDSGDGSCDGQQHVVVNRMVQVGQFHLPGCDFGIALRSAGNDRERIAVGAARIFDALAVDRNLAA